MYDEYKARKEAEIVSECMGCKGTGRITPKTKCRNCEGRGVDAPWGASLGHRHNAATRYVEKRLIRHLWVQWRE